MIFLKLEINSKPLFNMHVIVPLSASSLGVRILSDAYINLMCVGALNQTDSAP